MRVLLIEDDSAVAQSIELMLKSESFNVYTTDLGEEGVDLGKLAFVLALVAYGMPADYALGAQPSEVVLTGGGSVKWMRVILVVQIGGHAEPLIDGSVKSGEGTLAR